MLTIDHNKEPTVSGAVEDSLGIYIHETLHIGHALDHCIGYKAKAKTKGDILKMESMTFSSQAVPGGKPPPNKPVVLNPYVKRALIQSSIESLSVETGKYRQETNQAHAERQTLLQRLKSGKERTKDLTDTLREARDKHGGVQRESNLLEREAKTLRDELNQERQVLEELTVDIQAREKSETQERHDFCSKLSQLNAELGAMLHEQEIQRLAWLIHPEMPLEIFFPSEDEKMAVGGTEEADNETYQANEAETTTNNHDDDEYRELLRSALESLQRTAKEFEPYRAQKESLDDQLYHARQYARQKVMEQQPTPPGMTAN
eukprot:scaffold3785_cov165-Amphora_coffeaeformis.AAC.1